MTKKGVNTITNLTNEIKTLRKQLKEEEDFSSELRDTVKKLRDVIEQLKNVNYKYERAEARIEALLFALVLAQGYSKGLQDKYYTLNKSWEKTKDEVALAE